MNQPNIVEVIFGKPLLRACEIAFLLLFLTMIGQAVWGGILLVNIGTVVVLCLMGVCSVLAIYQFVKFLRKKKQG